MKDDYGLTYSHARAHIHTYRYVTHINKHTWFRCTSKRKIPSQIDVKNIHIRTLSTQTYIKYIHIHTHAYIPRPHPQHNDPFPEIEWSNFSKAPLVATHCDLEPHETRDSPGKGKVSKVT